MSRIIRIERCAECPHYNCDDDDDTGEHEFAQCIEMGFKDIQTWPKIPEWCPLEKEE